MGFSGWGDGGGSPPTSPNPKGLSDRFLHIKKVAPLGRKKGSSPVNPIQTGLGKRAPLPPNASTKLMLPEPHRTFAVEPLQLLPPPARGSRGVMSQLPQIHGSKPQTAPAGQLRVLRQAKDRRVVSQPPTLQPPPRGVTGVDGCDR